MSNPDTQRIGPSRRWYAAAAGLAVLGGAVFAAALAVEARSIREAVAAMPRVPLPGVAEVLIERPGRHTVYYLQRDQGVGKVPAVPPPYDLIVSGEDGVVTPVEPVTATEGFDQPDVSGFASKTVDIPAAGRYRFEASYVEPRGTPARLAVGDLAVKDRFGRTFGVFGGAAVCGVAVFASATIAVLTFVRRRGDGQTAVRP